MANPRVFVTQETAYDFSKAEQFGDVVFLSVDRKDDFHNIVNSGHNRRLLAHLRQTLRDYDEENDHLIIAGSPYVSAAVFWLLGRRGVKRINLLRWDNRDRIYMPLPLQQEMIDGN